MWLAMRLVLVGIIGILRYRWRNQSFDGSIGWRNEVLIRRKVSRSGVAWGLFFPAALIFELLREKRADRLLKTCGLVVEQQAGDPAFDSAIYIRSDDPNISGALGRSAEARAAALGLFQRGASRIVADGERLWVEIPNAAFAKDEVFSLLCVLRDSFTRKPRTGRDSNFRMWRVAAAETVIWSVVAYGTIGLFELVGTGQAVSDWPRFAMLVFTSTTATAATLATVLWFLLRRSSWASQVYREGAAVLFFVLPVAGTVVVTDANRFLDRSEPRHDTYTITDRRMQIYQMEGGRGRVAVQNEYHARIAAPGPDRPQLSRFIPVRKDVYDKPGSPIDVTWKKGALGLPWVVAVQQGARFLPTHRDRSPYGRGRLLGMAGVGLAMLLIFLLTLTSPPRRTAAR